MTPQINGLTPPTSKAEARLMVELGKKHLRGTGVKRRLFNMTCDHPSYALATQKEATESPHGEYRTLVTYHLFCQLCDTPVDIEHVR